MTILRFAAACGAALLASCAIGPDYHRPDAPAPAAFKEADGWKPAEPKTAASDTAWWTIYDDSLLDQLEREIDVSNQNLKAAEAAYRQAQALVGEARAGYWPTVTASASGQRSRSVVGSLSNRSEIVNQYSLGASASWVPDVWGKVRRAVEASSASAQASNDDLAGARLSAQTTLATDYFQLRVSDELKKLLDETVTAFKHSLEITQNQYEAGVVAQTDVITAETQLEGAQGQLINVGVQRAALEHAIAVLVGKPPAEFSIAPATLAREVPVTPPGVPSSLLERRPDVAAAERQVAAANAQIGVAIGGYYPDLTIGATLGFESSALDQLLRIANRAWSVGPTLSGTLFNGGLTKYQVEAARATYDQQVATYRQTVLSAFQQVEDQLAALRILEQQAQIEDVAVRSAREAVRLTLNQYEAGTVAYTSVVTAQATMLTDEQDMLTVLGNRLSASVSLVTALGGGWHAPDQVASTRDTPR